MRQVWFPADLALEQSHAEGCIALRDAGPAKPGERPGEVVVGLSPAFGREIWVALNGMTVAEVLRQLLAGIEEEGLESRLVRVRRSIDLGSIGSAAARLSGSGVGRAAGQGDGADPSGRPAAARKSRAVLDRAADHPRALPRAGAQRRTLREGPGTGAAAAPGVERAPRAPVSRPRRPARRDRAAAGGGPEPVELEAKWPS